MRPVRWGFDDGPTFDGFDQGTRWNGWPNISVTPAVREVVAAFLASVDGELGESNAAELRALPVGADGLVSLANGYTPTIEESAHGR